MKLSITLDIPDSDATVDPWELAWWICERMNDTGDFSADIDPTDAEWESV